MKPADLLARARQTLLVEAERINGPLASWDLRTVVEFSRVHDLRNYRAIEAVSFLLAQTVARPGGRLDS